MGDKIQALLCSDGLKESERLKAVLDYLDSIASSLEYYQNEVDIENKRLQDFIHGIEFEPLAEERSKICTQFRKSRQHRRKCKDKVGELKPIADVLESKEFKKVRNMFAQALGDIRRYEAYEQDRQYHPRVKE